MISETEVDDWVKHLVKRHLHQENVDPDKLDEALESFANSGDIILYASPGIRENFIKELTDNIDPSNDSFVQALIKCINDHPHISGAFVTGSHANSETAKLNSTVIELFGQVTNVVGMLYEHPEYAEKYFEESE